MLRFLLLLLAGLWFVPRLLRLLGAAKAGPRQSDRTTQGSPQARDPLRNLSQQDISDAEFEEIPPQE